MSKRRRQGARSRPATPRTPARPVPAPSAAAAPPPSPPSPPSPAPATDAALDAAPDAAADVELTGLDVLLQRARLSAAPATGTSRTSAALRTAGIPLLAAAVVGGSATGAAAAADTRPDTRPDGAAPAAGRGVVPQAGSHTPSALKAGLPSAAPGARAHAAAAPALEAQAAHAAAHAAARAAKRRTQVPRVTYVVKPGDTLSEIALRARISLAALTRANGLRATTLIHPGQRLVLPGVKDRTAVVRGSARRPVVHVVRAGDTVSEIAVRYRTTVAQIVAANRLGADALIRPGQKLRLPGAQRASRSRSSAPRTHAVVVAAGDTLSAIALREKVPLQQILDLNHLDLRSVIRPGQRLLVPGPAAVPNTFAGRTYPDAVARAAAANRAILAKRRVPSREQMRLLVARTAKRFGVDPALALAVAYQESGFNQRAVSPANAIGTMQVIPSSGVWASRLVGRRLDLLDPEDNVTAGVAILAALDRAASQRNAIAGYYQGLASVRRNGMFPDTRRYVANVLRLRERFA